MSSRRRITGGASAFDSLRELARGLARRDDAEIAERVRALSLSRTQLAARDAQAGRAIEQRGRERFQPLQRIPVSAEGEQRFDSRHRGFVAQQPVGEALVVLVEEPQRARGVFLAAQAFQRVADDRDLIDRRRRRGRGRIGRRRA